MLEHRRKNNLKYVISDFPPRPKRDILYSIMREGNEVYFINQGNEVISQVSTESYGFLTVDDTVYIPQDNPQFKYQDVQSGEGVLIENYDDSRVRNDFMLGMYIYVKNTDSELRIDPISNKGGVQSQPLLYADGTYPRYVNIKHLN